MKCRDCANEASPGRIRCANCLYIQAVKRRARYRKGHARESETIQARKRMLKDSHKCITCGAPLVEGEHLTCVACRIAHNETANLRR